MSSQLPPPLSKRKKLQSNPHRGILQNVHVKTTGDKYTQNNMLRILQQYMDMFDRAVKEHGEKVIVFMQVGDFYEIYGVDNEKERLGNIFEVSKILNMQISVQKGRGEADMPLSMNTRKRPLKSGVNLVAINKNRDRLSSVYRINA